MEQIQAKRRYLCTLIPQDLPDDQVEIAASAGTLPVVRLQAPNADFARASAYSVTGKRVHSVERISEVAA